MRRAFGILLVVAVIAGVMAIGFGAYQAGVDVGLSQSGQTVQVVGGAGMVYGYHPFFPFGFFLFPLGLLFVFLLIGGMFRRRHWMGGPGYYGLGSSATGGPADHYGPRGPGPWGHGPCGHGPWGGSTFGPGGAPGTPTSGTSPDPMATRPEDSSAGGEGSSGA
jgi:hypothetical protein